MIESVEERASTAAIACAQRSLPSLSTIIDELGALRLRIMSGNQYTVITQSAIQS